MAYLVLDLDLTAIVAGEQFSMLHPFHTLSRKAFAGTATLNNHKENILFKIINPNELAKLIEIAYTEHDGIIILTSGAWDSSIRSILAANLELTPKTKQKLSECHFHSIETDKAYFEDHASCNISLLGKAIRLDKIIENKPQLSSKFFAALDDNEQHIMSLKNHSKTFPIHATTDRIDKSFYEDAVNALGMAKYLEKRQARPDFFTQRTEKFSLANLRPGLIQSQKTKRSNKPTSSSQEIEKSPQASQAQPGFFTKPTETFTLTSLKPGLIQCKTRKANSTVYKIT